MPNPILTRQVRLALVNSVDAPSIPDLLSLIDEFVTEFLSPGAPDVAVVNLEEELQSIYHDVADYSSIRQMEVLLSILYHLRLVLPPASVISWFDLFLRPALREPKLPAPAVNHAKELIISALQKTQETYAEKIKHFRQRLMQLYLLDAFNETSGSDILEWVELDEEQRDKRTRWKSNLEDILLKYGSERPEDLFTEIQAHFATPSTRLQLLIFLNMYTSTPTFSSAAPVFMKHPLMLSLLYSLFLDNSSTVCTAGLTLIVKALPFFALYAVTDLKDALPNLLAILARTLSWRERAAVSPQDERDVLAEKEFEHELEDDVGAVLHIRSDVEWERLETTFTATPSLPPSSRAYFTFLYYFYPCNVLRFLRHPVQYLDDADLESPYVETWDNALNADKIRRQSENLLREHVCHPLLVWRDASAELSEPGFWMKYDISRIVSEATLLDVRTNSLAIRSRIPVPPSDNESSLSDQQNTSDEEDGKTTRSLHSIDVSSQKPVISLQDMINNSLILKSHSELEIVKPTGQWPYTILPSSSTSGSSGAPLEVSESINIENVAQVSHAISSLQREILLLRNELNFELWLSRENVKHIGRLYQERILRSVTEVERQGLFNLLRRYREQVSILQAELQKSQAQAADAKSKYAEWNNDLKANKEQLREDKKSWMKEAASLRGKEKESQALFAAQGRLLADATKEVFQLQTERKSIQHKIDRLNDYEKQIEQYVKTQRLWDEDFAKFKDRADQVAQMQIWQQQMQLRLESFAKTQATMDEEARAYRRKIQSLEARLAQMRTKAERSQGPSMDAISTFSSEKAALIGANQRLRDENSLLKDEIDEVKAMVEVLKGHPGGLVYEPRSNPLMFSQA